MKTELKTLKDFVFNEDPNNRDEWADGEIVGNRALAEILKAEAVKWVKHLRNKKDCPACEEMDTFVTGWENEPVLENVTSIIAVFKQFFNLTDGDLKEEKKNEIH